jgi:hypothetical protein
MGGAFKVGVPPSGIVSLKYREIAFSFWDVRTERDQLVLNSDLCRKKTHYKNWFPASFFDNVNIVMQTILF